MAEVVALPRITYTSMPSDLSPVHAYFDRELPLFKARLGARWLNRIAGEPNAEGEQYEAVSPIDSSLVLGRYVEASPSAVAKAVAAARRAFHDWGRTPWNERVEALRRVGRSLDESKYDFAMAILFEVGKTRLEAIGEAEEAVALVDYYCDQLARHAGYAEPPWEGNGEHSQTLLRPMGVFGVIAPFNYPVALSVNMLTAALLGGNAVVFKPSPNAGLTAGMLARIFEAELPRGVFNLICGQRAGEQVVAHRGIDGLAFTGSNATGMSILRSMANGPYMRPVLAEMGGKNAAYVSRSADVDAAVEGVAKSAFAMQGQKCTACSVAFVHASLYDSFVEKLVQKAKSVKPGDPSLREATNGPLINAAALKRYEEAVAHGTRAGRVVAGGARLSAGIYDRGCYVVPTVVTGLPADDWLFERELFAPILAVMPFDDLGQAIERGNRTLYGLTSGFYGRDQADIDLFLERSETGVQYVNRRTGATTGAWPGIQSFCGWKGSGVTGKGGLGPHYLPQFMREQSRTVRVE